MQIFILTFVAISAVGLNSVHATTVNNLASLKWGGYLVAFSNSSSTGIVDSIEASWIVPSIRASQNKTTSLEIIGIGSYSDWSKATMIQIGTGQFSVNGTVKYGALYDRAPEDQFGPVAIKELNHKVGPGTIISAKIEKVSEFNWTIRMVATNASSPSTAHIFSTSVWYNGEQGFAEWAVEIPPTIVLLGNESLANFGAVKFSGANATVNGVHQVLDSLPNTRLLFTDKPYNCLLADTGDVGSDGQSFTVSYLGGTSCLDRLTSALEFRFLTGGIIVAIATTGVVVAIVLHARKKPVSSGPVSPSKSESHCTNCGHYLRPGVKFCEGCGLGRPQS